MEHTKEEKPLFGMHGIRDSVVLFSASTMPTFQAKHVCKTWQNFSAVCPIHKTNKAASINIRFLPSDLFCVHGVYVY